MSDPVIEVRDLSVTFDLSRGSSTVVRDVDLAVERNEVLGVVGESGSGKSMVALSMLDAVVEPGRTEGTVTYHPADGEPVSVLDLDREALRRFRWEEVAMVFQGAMSSFNPVTRVRTHFRETLQDHDYDVETGMERAEDLLRELYLDPDRVLGSYPHELSGGMKQRALVALSLVLEPEVLILDEPTAALDLLMQRSIVSLLRDLRDELDLTMLFITHDLPLLTKIADRMAVMYAFDVIERAPTGAFLEETAHPYTRLLLNTTPDVSAPVADIQTIPGSKPDPVDRIPGCSFHPRCPISRERCESEEPALEDAGDDHVAACFFVADSRAEIPVRGQGGGDAPGSDAEEPGGDR